MWWNSVPFLARRFLAGVIVDVLTAVNMLFHAHIPIPMELQMMGKQKVSARLKCLVLMLPATASLVCIAG